MPKYQGYIMDRREFLSLLPKSALGLFLPDYIDSKIDAKILPIESLAHQPLGKKIIPFRYLDWVKNSLEEVYGLNVKISSPIPLPDTAYFEPNYRYKAPLIVDNINKYPGSEKIIAITPVDISQRENKIPDWGVIGVADPKGRSSVISIYRLGSGFELQKRLKNVSVHEYGHLIGFNHCSNELCTMSDIKGSLINLDKRKYGYFCNEHDFKSYNQKEISIRN